MFCVQGNHGTYGGIRGVLESEGLDLSPGSFLCLRTVSRRGPTLPGLAGTTEIGQPLLCGLGGRDLSEGEAKEAEMGRVMSRAQEHMGRARAQGRAEPALSAAAGCPHGRKGQGQRMGSWGHCIYRAARLLPWWLRG